MFVFGETPAQAARMGYDIAQQNRQALTRANELEADYAFRTNQMENAAAQNIAALARAQQQEQNQLAREAFVFGEQAKRQAQEDAFNKLRFDTQRKDVEREFAFEEKQLKKQDEVADEQLANAGAVLSDALSKLIPVQQQARKFVADIEGPNGKIARLIKRGGLFGFAYDESKKKLVDTGRGTGGGNVEDLNRELTMMRLALNDAKSKLPNIDREVNAARAQALNSGFSITPEGLRHIKRGKVFPFQFEAATAPAAGATMEFPTGTAGSVTPPDDRGMEPAAGRYIPGRVYGGKRYLGGPPTDRNSWQTVTR